MEVAAWALIVAGLLVMMGLSGSALKQLPLSTAMLYLPVGLAIGPLWFGLMLDHHMAQAMFLAVAGLFAVAIVTVLSARRAIVAA